MKGKIDNPAKYRLEGRGIAILGTWFVIAQVAVWWADHHLTGGTKAYVLATVFALPIIGIIIAFGLYLREEKDEFERIMITQSMVWGMGGTLAVATFWEGLDLFDQAKHIGPFGLVGLFLIFTKISEFFVRRSYR
jgi:hypothetical protein